MPSGDKEKTFKERLEDIWWYVIGGVIVVSFTSGIGLYHFYFSQIRIPGLYEREKQAERILKSSDTLGGTPSSGPRATVDFHCCVFDSVPIIRRNSGSRDIPAWVESIRRPDLKPFGTGILTFELTRDIGQRLIDNSSLSRANLADLEQLLDSAIVKGGELTCLNLIEITGNLAMLYDSSLTGWKEIVTKKIDTLSKKFALCPDLVELALLKKGILTQDCELIRDLISQVSSRDHTLYEHGLFEDSSNPMQLPFEKNLTLGGQFYAAFVLGFIADPTTDCAKEIEWDIVKAQKLGEAELADYLAQSRDRVRARLEKDSSS